jgi:opacity protein-like surface antigen
MARTLLLLLVACALLGSAAAGAAKPASPPGKPARALGGPAAQDFQLTMNMTGTATSASTGEAFSVTIRLTGFVTRSTPEGNGAQERGGLGAHVTITDTGGDATVQEFTTDASYHAERASYLGHGLDGWRYNLETRGRAGDLLHFGLHGNVTGTESEDGRTTYLLLGDGPVTLQDQGAHRAAHFQLQTSGTATEEPA